MQKTFAEEFINLLQQSFARNMKAAKKYTG